MSRRAAMLAGFIAVAIVAAGVAWALASRGPEPQTGGPAELPAVTGEGGVPTVTAPPAQPDETPAVDPGLTAADPVPDDVVSHLFGLVETDGDAPLPNETYTVEFVETTTKVHISGTFANGAADYEFEYEDGAWKLERDVD